ncbi:hypothetical protein GGX14DRAFT_391539 [Mycena pura]|uniref:Uncharacterized protein n=1 Tax=Mycena pura TaxID=153505 RepID=A0AAD6VKK7_9AGAR|nr:hypothetical protein GGX14DRAFT_391539 [Mycena pura]
MEDGINHARAAEPSQKGPHIGLQALTRGRYHVPETLSCSKRAHGTKSNFIWVVLHGEASTKSMSQIGELKHNLYEFYEEFTGRRAGVDCRAARAMEGREAKEEGGRYKGSITHLGLARDPQCDGDGRKTMRKAVGRDSLVDLKYVARRAIPCPCGAACSCTWRTRIHANESAKAPPLTRGNREMSGVGQEWGLASGTGCGHHLDTPPLRGTAEARAEQGRSMKAAGKRKHGRVLGRAAARVAGGASGVEKARGTVGMGVSGANGAGGVGRVAQCYKQSGRHPDLTFDTRSSDGLILIFLSPARIPLSLLLHATQCSGPPPAPCRATRLPLARTPVARHVWGTGVDPCIRSEICLAPVKKLFAPAPVPAAHLDARERHACGAARVRARAARAGRVGRRAVAYSMAINIQIPGSALFGIVRGPTLMSAG